jgi:tetratricopeptide (TPR) repeat protein
LNNLSEHYFQQGDFDQSAAINARMRSLAREYGHAAQLRWVDGQDVVQEFLIGNWDRSLELANSMIAAEAAEQTHYLSANAYQMRANIGLARGDSRALADSEKAVEYARRIGDAQALGPTLSGHIRLLAIEGDRTTARALLEEVIDFFTANPTAPYTWSPPFVWAFAAVGEPGEYLALVEREAPSPWSEAALATCAGDFVAAAEIYARIGAVSPAAQARVLAAEVLLERGDRRGSAQQLAEAIAFYRSVGATRFIRDAERLLAATA